MKKVYIAHPLRGSQPHTEEKCQKNIRLVTKLCLAISAEDKVIPFSPLHAFGYMNALKYDQQRAMRHCYALLDSCDELWVFGDWHSSQGCVMEVEHAESKGIPVRFMSVTTVLGGSDENI